jgi:GT2 family glycosyltransferase
MMQCSVVVPTYQRNELLARLLEALAGQDLPPDAYEVIVCDDAGTDETRSLVEQWARDHPVAARYVRGDVPGQGPAAMRNAGWRSARGAVIAFTNDDTVPEPDWLRQGLLALGDGLADAANGRIVVPLSDRPTDREREVARRASAGFDTANLFCRRSVLASIGGFDPDFRGASREASDLLFRLVEKGFDVVYANDASVVHPVRPAPWGASLRAANAQLFDALLYKKHPRLYQECIRPSRPVLYYGILAALSVVVVGTLADALVMTVGGLAGWCVLTGVIVARRLDETTRAPSHVLEVLVTSAVIPIVSVYWRVRGGVTFRVPFW